LQGFTKLDLEHSDLSMMPHTERIQYFKDVIRKFLKNHAADFSIALDDELRLKIDRMVVDRELKIVEYGKCNKEGYWQKFWSVFQKLEKRKVCIQIVNNERMFEGLKTLLHNRNLTLWLWMSSSMSRFWSQRRLSPEVNVRKYLVGLQKSTSYTKARGKQRQR
jgi:hypothetical protein